MFHEWNVRPQDTTARHGHKTRGQDTICAAGAICTIINP